MGKLNRTAAAAVIEGRIQTAVVGANRKLTRGLSGDLHGLLHGYAVISKQPHKIILRHHGFKTRTTLAAMHDFMQLLGVDGHVSFAGGGFWANINGQNYRGDYVIEVIIPARCGVPPKTGKLG